MNIFRAFSNGLKVILIASIPILVMSPIANASDHETQCFNNIQGKIPWNDEKNLNWDAENVKQLCKGTSNPTQPAECFNRVLEGHVEWGKGTNWEWKNIINLCSGTNDAKKSVDCFKQAIGTGTDWRDAIFMCQRALK